MIQLRREMEEAIDREDYERASEIRDQLKRFETATPVKPDSDDRKSDKSNTTDGPGDGEDKA